MNNQNRVKLNKDIEILNGLHFKNENIMVTGSIALDAQGLLSDRIAHDVDLIIKMDEQAWKCLKLIDASILMMKIKYQKTMTHQKEKK